MSNEIWKKLTRLRNIRPLERFETYIRTLSSGDRILFYFFSVLICIASLFSIYTFEQSLLVQIPTYGGTLVEGEIGSPQFTNPILAISDADRDLSALTYAGLMGLSGSGSLIPILAKSYTISADGKSYTFILRKNAKFSDGTPVTANDVVFTVQQAQNTTLNSPEYADWSGVNVTAVDQRTVRFTLTKPYAPFLGLTTLGILPSRLWQNVSSEEFPFSVLEMNPVGAGPFKIIGISRDSSGLIQSVSLVANSYYVFGRPYLDGIRINFYPNTTDLTAALKSGAIQSAYDIPSSNELTAPYARVFGIFWNPSQKPVYTHIEIRKALSLAINRSEIVNKVLGGYATALMGPIPPGGNVKQVPVPQSTNTIADAAQILESAGWVYNGSLRAWKNVAENQTLDHITIRTSNVPEMRNVASSVRTDWQQLGIPVDIELYEPGDLSQNVIRPRKYGALLYGMVIGRSQDLYAFWDSQERNDPGLNIAQYANKNVDTLLEDVRNSTNLNTRTTDLQKIEDTIAADYPAAFIYAPDFIYSVPVNLHGVRLPQIIMPADRFATVASWYMKTDRVWPFFAH